MMEYDRVRLKTAAKQALKYQRPHPMLITLLFIILVNVGSRIISAVLGAASGSSTLSKLYLQGLLTYEDQDRPSNTQCCPILPSSWSCPCW